jgi:hypothetical protein
MALTIGGLGGYESFEGYTIDSYRLGALDHYIAERPVIEEMLTVQDELRYLMEADSIENPALKAEVLRRLGLSDDDINRIIIEGERQAMGIPDDPTPQDLTEEEAANADNVPPVTPEEQARLQQRFNQLTNRR